MIYKIHGEPIEQDGSECGIYKSPGPLLREEYAVMDIPSMIKVLNGLSLDNVLEAVTQLRDRAAQQASWKHTPQNLGFPILRQTPDSTTSIDEVKGNIQNTLRFCDDVLAALSGQ